MKNLRALRASVVNSPARKAQGRKLGLGYTEIVTQPNEAYR